MRGIAAIAGLAMAPLMATAAVAANCTDGLINQTHAPDFSSFTVIFDAFTASVDDPARCMLDVNLNPGNANPIPAGVVIAYSADYRGSLDSNSVARIVVLNGNVQLSKDVEALNDTNILNELIFQGFAGTNGEILHSDILLAMLSYDGAANQFTLESIDYGELARTTTTDIQTSVDQLAGERTSVVTHLNATMDLLSGAGQPLEGPDGFAALGGFGSVTAGVSGRRTLDDGFSLLGGVAFVDQTAGGATANGLVVSGSARYLTPGSDMVRPFGEIGLHAAPVLGLSFSRDYVTSTGTTNAVGSTTGSFFGGYVKGGVLFAPDPNDDIVFAATLAKDWLSTADYSETLSGSNLFAAHAPAQSGSFDTVKLGADWTTRVMPDVDLTFSAAVGRTIAENGVATDVAFAGSFTGAPRSEMFAEYGVRASHDFSPGTNLGVFVHGATGEYSGTHVQVGGDVHVSF